MAELGTTAAEWAEEQFRRSEYFRNNIQRMFYEPLVREFIDEHLSEVSQPIEMKWSRAPVRPIEPLIRKDEK